METKTISNTCKLITGLSNQTVNLFQDESARKNTKKWQPFGNTFTPTARKNTKKWQPFGNTFTPTARKNTTNGNPLETLLLNQFYINHLQHNTPMKTTTTKRSGLNETIEKTSIFELKHNNSPLSGSKFCFHSINSAHFARKKEPNYKNNQVFARRAAMKQSVQSNQCPTLKIASPRLTPVVRKNRHCQNFYFSLHTPQPPLSYI